MITEDYISFETSKLLKEKGFDEKCRTYYKVFPESRIAAIYHSSEDRGVSEDDPNEILCPTIQMVMKWLREVHRLDIDVSIEYKNSKKVYYYSILKKTVIRNIDCLHSETNFDSYEAACEEAIKYSLKHLI